MDSRSILKVIKPLHGVPEAGNHWFKTYHDHHLDKLNMQQSTYDPCLVFTPDVHNFLGVIDLQTDDSLILPTDHFALREQETINTRHNITIPNPYNSITQQQ